MAKPHPTSIERKYYRELMRRQRAIGLLVRRAIAIIVERHKDEINARAEERADSEEDIVREIKRALKDVDFVIEGEWSEARTIEMLEDLGEEVDAFEKGQLSRTWKTLVGVEPFFSDRTTKTLMEEFAAENLQLITNLHRDTIAQLNDKLVDAARSGTRSEDFSKVISERLGVGASRAMLIARDQIGSMSGKLTEHRQGELGITRYRWITSRDERVRPEHKERDGNIYTWAEGPPDGDHPGREIQCRCTASPILDDDDD